MDRILEELVKQLSIQNRLNVARELTKVGYYESEDYVEALRDLDYELREDNR